MFHSVKENTLYDFINKKSVTTELYKDKTKYDICQFLDDISIWMDKNKEYISDEYLPLAVLAVGNHGPTISAFLFGILSGKALEKNGITISNKESKITPSEIKKIMEDDMGYTEGIFDNIFDKKEKKDGKGKKPGEHSK